MKKGTVFICATYTNNLGMIHIFKKHFELKDELGYIFLPISACIMEKSWRKPGLTWTLNRYDRVNSECKKTPKQGRMCDYCEGCSFIL